MTDESIELMFSSADAVTAIHYPPGDDAENLTGIFGESLDDSSEFRETSEGHKRLRTGKLVILSTVTVTLGNEPSRFKIRDEMWKAIATAPDRGVQSVRLERMTQSTQRRQAVQHHQ